eukprot:TRINITY_DN1177_c0_g1_i1.p1 TRINITY_DN1177_c0_g1~~TRINITY_DN1177_c0_g1_i1.p1  ORF type:complete len:209 (-),score=85.83 TRINITY_DN1177_c0_g1_i1:293-919(-)
MATLPDNLIDEGLEAQITTVIDENNSKRQKLEHLTTTRAGNQSKRLPEKIFQCEIAIDPFNSEASRSKTTDNIPSSLNEESEQFTNRRATIAGTKPGLPTMNFAADAMKFKLRSSSKSTSNDTPVEQSQPPQPQANFAADPMKFKLRSSKPTSNDTQSQPPQPQSNFAADAMKFKLRSSKPTSNDTLVEQSQPRSRTITTTITIKFCS